MAFNYRAAFLTLVAFLVVTLCVSAVQTDRNVRQESSGQRAISPTLQAWLDEPADPPPCHVDAATHLAGVVDEVCERGAVVAVDRRHLAYCHPSTRRWILQDR